MNRPIVLALLLGSSAFAAGSAVPGMMTSYTAAGAGPADANRGAAMWTEAHPSADGGPARSCTSCHPANHAVPGTHAKTGEAITPLSPKVDSQRLSDPLEIEKWFGRNCKWTIGRECTPQEKADFLAFINT